MYLLDYIKQCFYDWIICTGIYVNFIYFFLLIKQFEIIGMWGKLIYSYCLCSFFRDIPITS